MDRVISSKLGIFAIIAMIIFVANTYVYATFANEAEYGWWIMDKLNDRIFSINLLLITSFAFIDVVYRLFAYLNVFYIVWLAYYEVLYILKLNKVVDWCIGDYEFSIISAIIFILGGILLLIFAIYDNQRRHL